MKPGAWMKLKKLLKEDDKDLAKKFISSELATLSLEIDLFEIWLLRLRLDSLSEYALNEIEGDLMRITKKCCKFIVLANKAQLMPQLSVDLWVSKLMKLANSAQSLVGTSLVPLSGINIFEYYRT